MKRVLIFLFAWTLVVFALQAQTEIDKVRFWAVYKFSYKTSPEQPTFDWEIRQRCFITVMPNSKTL